MIQTVKQELKKATWEEKLILVGGVALLGWFGWKAIRNGFQNVQRNNEIKNLDNGQHSSFSTSYAAMLYSAFFQSGSEWISDFMGDGTNQELVYDVARQMYQNKVAFSQVNSSYQALYKRDLFKDLQKELSSEEQIKFNSILQKGLGGIVPFRNMKQQQFNKLL